MKHEKIKLILKSLYPTTSVYIEGRTGIGKSDVIKKTAEEIATKNNKEYVNWNKLAPDEKLKMAYEKDKYFILVDLRLSQMEPADLTGIPFPENGACIYKKQLWAHALHNNPGMLFLDEMNLANPSVLSASYQVLLDKVIGDIPMHEGVLVVGAGNLQEDKAFTFELPLPIISRVFRYNLDVPEVDDWTDWALSNGVDSRVVTYLNRFKQMIFYEKDDLGLLITPRGWEFVGRAIKGMKDWNLVRDISEGILKGKAGEFVSFLKLSEKIPKPEDILDGKSIFPKELDQKFIACSILSEHYRDTKKKETLQKIFALNDKTNVDTEFHILLLRMCRAVDQDFFRSSVLNDKQMLDLVMKKYHQYLVE